MKKLAFSIALLLSVCWTVLGHEYIINPTPRTKECMVNGIIMTSTTDPNQVQYDSNTGHYMQQDCMKREQYFHVHNWYLVRPCGNSRRSGLDDSVELCNRYEKDDQAFDFYLPPTKTPIPQYEANSVLEIAIRAWAYHPGTTTIRLCYDLPCMKWESYEKYILGYWYNEGVMGETAQVKIKVKLPNRNCERCVLQFVTDSCDARSYVNCADIKIVNANPRGIAQDVSYCNGHPLCDCGASSYSQSFFGLKGKCPGRSSNGGGNDIVTNVGATQFCNWCISNGCAYTCGSPIKAVYNTPNKNFNNHVSALDNPTWIQCTPSTCYCPGCRRTRVAAVAPPAEALPVASENKENNESVEKVLEKSFENVVDVLSSSASTLTFKSIILVVALVFLL